MGGFGSGQRGGKDCTGDMRQVDVRRLQRDGYLSPGMAYGWHWKRDGEIRRNSHGAGQGCPVTNFKEEGKIHDYQPQHSGS